MLIHNQYHLLRGKVRGDRAVKPYKITTLKKLDQLIEMGEIKVSLKEGESGFPFFQLPKAQNQTQTQ